MISPRCIAAICRRACRNASLVAVGVGVAATALFAQNKAPGPEEPGASGRGRNPGARAGQPPRPRPGFWNQQFNSAAAFRDLGVATFRHGALVSRKLHFNGAAETEIGYTIYLPPDYDKSDERYPIIYFLHGLGGNENTVAPVVQKADELIKAGELPPFIIATAACGRSFYGNQFEGRSQTHDFYFDDFIPRIEKTFRVKSGARYRHIQGFSMGGYGALMYAFKHPDMFGAVTEIAGALVGARFNVWAEMYDSKEENYRPFDLAMLLEEHKEVIAGLRIAQWIGSADVTRAANEQFHRIFAEKSVAHVYNDWNSRPQLNGVGHELGRYYALYGKEILTFHAEAFGK